MRSSYDAVNLLDFIPMDQFEVGGVEGSIPHVQVQMVQQPEVAAA
jgi:hypothetical protein